MKSYSEREIFSKSTIEIFQRATSYVGKLKALSKEEQAKIRCHELARAIILVLRDLPLFVIDGRYGSVDHSWIEILVPYSEHAILDVYSVGRLPMVQLLDLSLEHAKLYQKGELRNDLDFDLTDRLVRIMESDPSNPKTEDVCICGHTFYRHSYAWTDACGICKCPEFRSRDLNPTLNGSFQDRQTT